MTTGLSDNLTSDLGPPMTNPQHHARHEGSRSRTPIAVLGRTEDRHEDRSGQNRRPLRMKEVCRAHRQQRRARRETAAHAAPGRRPPHKLTAVPGKNGRPPRIPMAAPGRKRRPPHMKEVGRAHQQPRRTGRKTAVHTEGLTGQNKRPPRMP